MGKLALRQKEFSTVRSENIAAEPLSATQWRVCDRATPPSDGQHVLGFIEQTGDAYETIKFGLGHAINCRAFGNLLDAIAFFHAEGNAASARARILRPLMRRST